MTRTRTPGVGSTAALVLLACGLVAWFPTSESRGAAPREAGTHAPRPDAQPGDENSRVENGRWHLAQDGGEGGVRERVNERIRVMRAWRLTEVLELDEATALALFSRLDTFDSESLPLREQVERAGRELRRLLESGSEDNARIGVLTEEVLAGHLAMEQLRADLVRGSSDILDERQRAALMLFLPEFDREVREMIREVRRSHRRGSGAHEGSGTGGRRERGRRGGRRGRPPGMAPSPNEGQDLAPPEHVGPPPVRPSEPGF